MGNSYKNCKIQDNTAELIYENGSLFVTIFENNIVHKNPASKVLQSRRALFRRPPHRT